MINLKVCNNLDLCWGFPFNAVIKPNIPPYYNTPPSDLIFNEGDNIGNIYLNNWTNDEEEDVAFSMTFCLYN